VAWINRWDNASRMMLVRYEKPSLPARKRDQ
jgi:hypothetical protein